MNWDLGNLVFLDEVSLDNRGMRRTHGYGESGKPLFVTGEYVRLPRVSLLCFITQHGLFDAIPTEGTFTREKFFQCCKDILDSGIIHPYPGPSSIWIMDGAKIHKCDTIINFLRSRGIVPLFLPAYCPFYNPIEIFFGILKRRLRRCYKEGQVNGKNLQRFVMHTLVDFVNYDMRGLFRHCGYLGAKKFDPNKNYKQSVCILPD